MTSYPVALLGDVHSHGGAIITASPTVKCQGTPVARFSDKADCILHGGVSIATLCADTVTADGLAVATSGSMMSCGAEIIATGITCMVGR